MWELCPSWFCSSVAKELNFSLIAKLRHAWLDMHSEDYLPLDLLNSLTQSLPTEIHVPVLLPMWPCHLETKWHWIGWAFFFLLMCFLQYLPRLQTSADSGCAWQSPVLWQSVSVTVLHCRTPRQTAPASPWSDFLPRALQLPAQSDTFTWDYICFSKPLLLYKRNYIPNNYLVFW